MTIIELAPHHKVGLTLANPIMPAAGCFGTGREYAPLIDLAALGAVVVGPVTGRPRRGSEPPRLLPVPSGVLLHTGLANPGISALIRQAVRVWRSSPVPVIVHVAGTDTDEVASCCERLAAVEAVAGVEMGLPDAATPELAADLTRAACTSANRPVLVRLPLADADRLCEAAAAAGADALTVAAPPRGTAWHPGAGRYISGRLYGPFVLPLALRALRRVAEMVSLPLVGCGGITAIEDAAAFLRAGAVAVQVDSALWRDPSSLARLARALAPEVLASAD